MAITFVTHQDSWTSHINRNWLETRQEIQAKALLVLLLQHGGVRTSNRFLPHLLPEVGQACSLYGARVGLEGWLRCFARPLGRGVYKGACTVAGFCSRLFRCGIWAFGLFVSFIQNLPLVQTHAVIFSPTVAQGQVCPGAGIVAPQQGARGPRLSHFLQRGNLFMTMDAALGVHPHAPVPKQSWQSVYVLSRSVVSNSATPWSITYRLLCPWRFSRQEYWSGLSCSLPGDLPDSGIEPVSSASLAVLADSLPNEPLGNLTLPQNCGFLSLPTMAVLLFIIISSLDSWCQNIFLFFLFHLWEQEK